MKKTNAKKGRPPEAVPEEIKEDILAWVADGKTLRDFCRLPDSPAWRTVYHWLEKDTEFLARFAHAREMGHDAIAEDTLALIDTRPEMAISDSGARMDSAFVAWKKNQVEQRMKLLAKWNPKKYGDRVGVDHQGNISLVVVSGVPEAED